MEKQADLVLVTVLLLAAFNVSSAQEENAYFKIGGELNLRPTFTDRIDNILWKLKGDLVAEWVEKVVPLHYYGRFEGRTTLDTSTGLLTMKNLSKEDEGAFTLEINNKIQSTRYIGIAIEEVPIPTILTQPLACGLDKVECDLSCDGEIEKAGPVTYSWKEGEGSWQEKDSKITIKKTETGSVKTYSCMIKNPISEKRSKPKVNPFYVESSAGSYIGLIVGLSLLVVILGVFGGLVWKYNENIRGWIGVNQRSDSSDHEAGNKMFSPGASSPPPPTGGTNTGLLATA